MKERSGLSIFLIFSILIALMMAPGYIPGRSTHADAPQDNQDKIGSTPFPNFDIRAEHYLNLDPSIEDSSDSVKAKLARRPRALAENSSLERSVRHLQMRLDPERETPRLLFSYDEP